MPYVVLQPLQCVPIKSLKFDSLEQADMVLAKMDLPESIGMGKSVGEARKKKTMVLMDDIGHVIIVWLSELPMKSYGIDFEKYLD